jgi:predicted phage tail protein
MRAGRFTTRLLTGCGVAAGFVLLGAAWASSAGAAGGGPPPKRPNILTAPASPDTDPTPTWTFVDPGGDPDDCSLSFGGVDVFAPAPCTGTVTYDLTGRSYGTYTLTIENSKAFETSTYTFVPAAPTITAAPASPGNDTTPTWTFTLPARTTGTCSITGGAPVACAGSQTFTVATGGAYTFTVVATGDGIDSAPATSTYTLDTIPPPAPVITAGPASVSIDDTPTWTFTTSGDAVATRCSLVRGTTTVFASAPCTSPKTYDLTAQPDAAYTFGVVAVDAAGNVSPATTSSYTLQRVAPPTITSAPASPGNDTTPTWTFTLPAGTTGVCSLNGGTAAACSGSRTYTVTTDGTYTFSVVAVQTGTGRQSAPATSTYTLDVTPPAAPALTGTPPSPGTDRTPTWSFTKPTGAARVECTLRRGAAVVAGPSTCSGSFTNDLSGKPDGTYVLSLVAIDAVGNRSATRTSSYTIDRTAPPAPTITSGPTGLTNTSSPSWTFTTEAGSTTTCWLSQGNTIISGPSTCSGSATYSLASRPDGAYTFTVRAADAPGNTGPSMLVSITVDRVAPPAPSITGGPTGTSADDTPTWTFKLNGGAAAATCTVRQGTTVVSGPAACTSPASFDLTALPDATYTFSVAAQDAAGNVSPPATGTYALRASRPVTPAVVTPTTTPPAPGPVPAPVVEPTPAPTPSPTTPTTRPGRAPVTTPGGGRSGGGGAGGGSGEGVPAITVPTTEPEPTGIISTAGRVATEATKRAVFPFALLLLVVLFLLIQDQIDRRDPKLADAPVHAGDDLEFGPPPSRRGNA